MKKEITAREFFDMLVNTIERMETKHPEPKRTALVADEIVRVTTIEVTEVIPQEFCELMGREMTEQEISSFKRKARNYLREYFSCDDLHIKVQQFVTKCHEEET